MPDDISFVPSKQQLSSHPPDTVGLLETFLPLFAWIMSFDVSLVDWWCTCSENGILESTCNVGRVGYWKIGRERRYKGNDYLILISQPHQYNAWASCLSIESTGESIWVSDIFWYWLGVSWHNCVMKLHQQNLWLFKQPSPCYMSSWQNHVVTSHQRSQWPHKGYSDWWRMLSIHNGLASPNQNCLYFPSWYQLPMIWKTNKQMNHKILNLSGV